VATLPNAKSINRRQFLKTSGAVGGLAVTGAALAQDSASVAAPALASPADLSIAEKLAGVAYSDAERAKIYDGLEDTISRISARREGAPLANTDAPAQVFDPRLKGRTYPPQQNSVKIAAPTTNEGPGPLPRDEDVAFAPVWKLGAWIRSGQISCVRLMDIYLQRIRRIAPKLECFVTVLEESARAEARLADDAFRAGRDKGPLQGIPYGLKDLADTAGIRTTWGAEPYKNRMPTEDAEIVKRLRAAGAILIGKTTLGALAYGDLWFGGLTRNPWNIEEGSSGSSAGSASATAAGLCGFAIGTETLGSIISPTSRCGAVGLRPTFGRVPRTGAMALCWSLDKIGPICRYVEDTALVLDVLNGADEGDASSLDHGFHYDGVAAIAEDIRIGYDPAWFEEATASDKAVLARVTDMGFKLTEIKLPDLPYGTLITTLEVEAAAAFEELTLSNQDDLMRWQEARAWPNTFRAAHFIPAVEALQVDRFRRKVMEVMADIYEKVDVIICPNFTGDMLMITNYTGSPSLSLPVGMEERGNVPLTAHNPPAEPQTMAKSLPHSITLWGTMFREDQLLAIGRLLEESIRFHAHNRPDL
jgi:Asp-tRNA(Asn)/Glu-tRNA(Gln) amidotransferase A subunit family amidase